MKSLVTKAKAKIKADSDFDKAYDKEIDKLIDKGVEKHGSITAFFEAAKLSKSRKRGIMSGKSPAKPEEIVALAAKA